MTRADAVHFAAECGRSPKMKRTIRSTLGLAVMVTLVGCTIILRQSGYPRSLTYPGGEYPAPLGDLDAVTWVVCSNEQDAEVILVLDLTIPGVINGKRQEFPIRRAFSFDLEGNPDVVAGAYSLGVHADGVSRDGNRGTGYSVSYSLDSRDGHSVMTHLTCHWTTDDGCKGQLEAQIGCLIGVADEWALSDTARLKVSYRPIRKADEQGGGEVR